jgi:predicted RNA-binding Zn ribbon-like protein
MVFAHDTEEALQAAAGLVNTDQPEGDDLAGTVDLERFVARWRWTGHRRHDEAELAAVRDLRPRLRRLWSLGEADLAEEVNGMLRAAHALPQVVRHDGFGFHLHATADDAPLADRMAVEAAMALVDVIRQGEIARLRTCEATGCGDVLVDLSRNRSRRYCSTACTNRMNVAAYRARRSAAG